MAGQSGTATTDTGTTGTADTGTTGTPAPRAPPALGRHRHVRRLSRSELDRDAVVDAAEHERAERERDHAATAR